MVLNMWLSFNINMAINTAISRNKFELSYRC
jgi:hypothetical protein